VLKLIIEDDEGRKTVVPFVRDEITIGRQEGNTIRLTERNVSRRHARLMRQNGHVLIEDLGSYNGIRVNGDRIKGQVPLADGDLVQIGDYDLALQAERSEAPTVSMAMDGTVPLTASPQRASGPHKRPDTAPTVTNMPVAAAPVPSADDEDVHDAPSATPDALEPPRHQSTAVIRMDQVQSAKSTRSQAALDPAESPRLVVLTTDFAGQEFPCVKTELKIGRTDDNDIALDHRSLSRTHCKIVREDNGEWRVIDMQSANGLIVNGEPYAQVTLRSGDVIELGHVKLRFLGPGVPSNKTFGSNVTMETDEPVSRRKSPLLPVVMVLLLAAVGLGGYLVFNGQPSAGPGGGKPSPSTAVDTPPDGDEKATAAAKVAEAKQAMLELDFIRAEALLRAAKVNENQLPEAATLQTKLAGEGGFKRALEQAKAAIGKGELQEARRQLDASRDTDLLKPTWQTLETALAEATKAALAPGVPQPRQPVAAGDDEEVPEVQAAIASAKEMLVKGEYRRTINLLNGTTKKYPGCHECKALIGSAFCRDDDQTQCVRWYTRYLAEAPQTHPRYGQVKQLLLKFQADKRKQGE
jgi:ABC transport system ATP-binding/permease protein